MFFFRIIGYVLLVILLLVIALLLLNVDLIVEADHKNGLKFSFRVLGKTITPKSKGGEKTKKDKKPFLRFFGLEELSDGQAFKKAIAENGIFEVFRQIVSAVIGLVGRLLWAVKKCKIVRLKIVFKAGGENAALTYGTACAFIYSLIGSIAAVANSINNAYDTDIGCDFNLEKSEFDISLIIRMRVIFGVIAFIKILADNKKKEAV